MRRVVIGLGVVIALLVAGCVGVLLGSTTFQEPEQTATIQLSNATVEMNAAEQLERQRWQRHFDLLYIVADIRADMREIEQDGQYSGEEMQEYCWKVGDWTRQLTRTQDFMAEYRRLEPEAVRANPALRELESEALRWQTRVQVFERECG